jgi:hypothetical protein
MTRFEKRSVPVCLLVGFIATANAMASRPKRWRRPIGMQGRAVRPWPLFPSPVCEKRTFVAQIGFGGGPYNPEQIRDLMKDYIPRAIAALQEAF